MSDFKPVFGDQRFWWPGFKGPADKELKKVNFQNYFDDELKRWFVFEAVGRAKNSQGLKILAIASYF